MKDKDDIVAESESELLSKQQLQYMSRHIRSTVPDTLPAEEGIK